MDLQVLGIWLHTVAFVIAWGYYGILARVVLPALERSLDGSAGARTLDAIEARALPLLILSAGLFIVTGTYLLAIDPRYEGIGAFFANSWTILMAIKHVVVIVFIALAIAIDRLVRGVRDSTDDATRATSLRRLRLSAEGATGLGALIALLTAAAQLPA